MRIAGCPQMHGQPSILIKDPRGRDPSRRLRGRPSSDVFRLGLRQPTAGYRHGRKARNGNGCEPSHRNPPSAEQVGPASSSFVRCDSRQHQTRRCSAAVTAAHPFRAASESSSFGSRHSRQPRDHSRVESCGVDSPETPPHARRWQASGCVGVATSRLPLTWPMDSTKRGRAV